MNQIETKVLELIGEDPDSPDVFLNTEAGMAPIRDSINDAVEEIAMLTGGRQEKYLLPLRTQQMFYRFSLNSGHIGWVTDAWHVTQRYRLEQTDVIKLSAYDRRWMVTNAEPRTYFQIGDDVVGFWPKPSGDTTLVELNIVVIPERYTFDNDRVVIRREFESAITHYAVAEYWASRGDAREATEHYQQYINMLGLRERYSMSHDRMYRAQTQKDPWPKETA